MFFNTAGTPSNLKRTTYLMYTYTEYQAVTAEANEYTSENAGYLAVYMHRKDVLLGSCGKTLEHRNYPIGANA